MICVFGSINVDHVMRVHRIARPGETVLASDLIYRQGGKGANQAVAAARAGAQVAMIGAVGDDPNGASARANLIANSVEDSGVAVVEHPTGCAFISVDDHGENAITVVGGANRSARLPDLPAACGMLVCQLELPVDEVATALEFARARGCGTLLNFAPVPQDLTREQAARLAAATQVLVVNEGEFESLRSVLEIEAVRASLPEISARLACAIVVTMGAAGVRFCVDGGPEERVRAFPVEVADSTGAGDTFVGAFAAFLSAGESFGSAVRYASVAGALACTRIGAQEGIPSRSEILAATSRFAALDG